jgi:hypothetical protein
VLFIRHGESQNNVLFSQVRCLATNQTLLYTVGLTPECYLTLSALP